MHYLMDQGWITCRESKAENKGRPVKIYKLAKPIADIMDSIEKETENKAKNQLALIRKLRNFIR
jgi:predicted transcriptional regulator